MVRWVGAGYFVPQSSSASSRASCAAVRAAVLSSARSACSKVSYGPSRSMTAQASSSPPERSTVPWLRHHQKLIGRTVPALRQGYGIVMPPSTGSVMPVTYDAASLAKKTATDASSIGSPSRPAGVIILTSSGSEESISSVISVGK